jgi:site-specific DNA-methyltransferase (cytosine-N4-specific)
VSRKHEQWFHFTKQERYYANIDAVREQYAPASVAIYSSGNAGRCIDPAHPSAANRGQTGDLDGWTGNPLGKVPGSWWNIPTQPLRVPPELGVDHFAAFPIEWPRRLILGWSPDDGTVLDPFGGTGTTAAVAKALGRTGISVDLSADYLRLADWRTNGDGYEKIHAKIHPTTKRTRAVPKQAETLFGGEA